LNFLQQNNRKYFKRGDLLTTEPKTPSNVKSNNSKYDSNSRIDAENSMIQDNSQHALPRLEVIRKLRERGHPILLFAESEMDSFKRLRRCEILEPEVNKVYLNIYIYIYIYILYIRIS
jgi:pre-mRNA-splicing factor 18